MKKLQMILFAAFFTLIANGVFAQTQKTDSFSVLGNCGMCKKKIEKAAKDAGATTADWNKDTKIMTVSYKAKSTDLPKIQKKIAEVGYDNAGAKSTDEAYNNLHGCCQYDRDAKPQPVADKKKS